MYPLIKDFFNSKVDQTITISYNIIHPIKHAADKVLDDFLIDSVPVEIATTVGSSRRLLELRSPTCSPSCCSQERGRLVRYLNIVTVNPIFGRLGHMDCSDVLLEYMCLMCSAF